MAIQPIGIKISATDEASGVFARVAQEAGKLGSSVQAAGTNFAALAGTAAASLGALSFATKIKDAIDLADSFNKLSQKTGIAVEELSKLKYAAGLSDVSTESLANGIKKLNVAVSAAANGSKEQANVFKALGISLKDAGGEVKTADKVFAELATKFSESADGANKTAVAVAVLGKNGADLVPLLNAGAGGLKTLGDEAKKLGLVLSTEFAKQAEEFNDNLHKVQIAGQGLFITLGSDLVKGLGDTAKAMAEAAIEGGKYAAVLAGIRTLLTGTDQFKNDKAMVENTETLLQLENQRLALKRQGFAEDSRVIRNLDLQLAGIKENLKTTQAYRTVLQQAAADVEKATKPAPTKDSDAIKKAAAALSAPAAAVAGPFDAINKSIKERLALVDSELTTGRALTEQEKFATKVTTDLADAKGKITAKQRESIAASLDELKAKDLLLQIDKSQIAAAKESATERQKLRNADYDSITKFFQAELEANNASIKSLRDNNEALKEEVATIGLTEEALTARARALLADTIAEKENEAARLESIGTGADRAAQIRIEVGLLKERSTLIGQKGAATAAAEAARLAAEEWKKTADIINQSLTDALMRGFEDGKGFAENFRDTVTNMFKTLVLRPVISAIVNPVAQSVTGVLGSGSSIFAGGIANGLGTMAGALGPVAIGIAALSTIFGDHGFKSSASTGTNVSDFDAAGKLIASRTRSGDTGAVADSTVASLQASYLKAAMALGIGTASTNFSYSGNTGAQGESPNFALGGAAGGRSFYQGETSLNDAAVQLAASRAVFAALQGSDLPKYLSTVFNSLDAGASSQEQIASALAFATSLKSVRDALTETRTPLQILQDNLTAGTAALHTTAESFKTDFVAAIDAGIGPETLAQWQALQTNMDQLAAATGKADTAVASLGRSIADIASERTRLQDQLDNLTLSAAQLQQKERNALDESNRALFDQVQAQISLKDATAAAAEAATAAAAAYAAAAAQRLSSVSGSATDALAGVQRAVAAQKAIEAATIAAQKETAAAIYKAQASSLQTSMDAVKASLDTVGASVGKLKSLSGSLKGTLDGMRVLGSEGAYRASAQAQISAAVAAARAGGPLPLDGQLESALRTVAQPSEQLFATFADYAKDFFKTANDIAELSGLTDSQLSIEEQTQKTLQAQSDRLADQAKLLKDGFADQVSVLDDIYGNAQKQLDAANGLNVSVLSIGDALAVFNSTVLALTAERASQGLATAPGVAASRATAIRDYITSAMGAGLSGTDLANTIASKAKEVGTNEAEIARAIGWDQSKVRDFFAGAGIPQFAVGTNYVPADTLAYIHQGEAIVPAAYNPAATGVGNARLEALVEKLTQQVAALQESAERGNQINQTAANALNGRQGVPILVEIAA